MAEDHVPPLRDTDQPRERNHRQRNAMQGEKLGAEYRRYAHRAYIDAALRRRPDDVPGVEQEPVVTRSQETERDDSGG